MPITHCRLAVQLWVERLPNGEIKLRPWHSQGQLSQLMLLTPTALIAAARRAVLFCTGTSYAQFYSVVVLAAATSLLTIYVNSGRHLTVLVDNDPLQGRDFLAQPFDLMDAYALCVNQASIKHGSYLLRERMLPLSTRFEEREGIYLVVLSADVGRFDDWAEATILCSIDPEAHRLSYYKEVYAGEQSILAKTMSALGSMFD